MSARRLSGVRIFFISETEAHVGTDKLDERDQTLYDRRGFLQCMAWVGTAAVWTMAGGVLKGIPVEAAARDGMKHMNAAGGLRFAQISDSHIGFDKPANTDVTATLRAAVDKIKAAA